MPCTWPNPTNRRGAIRPSEEDFPVVPIVDPTNEGGIPPMFIPRIRPTGEDGPTNGEQPPTMGGGPSDHRGAASDPPGWQIRPMREDFFRKSLFPMALFPVTS